MTPDDDDRTADREEGSPFPDRRTWVPPPSEEWQTAHGWTDGEPPTRGNGKQYNASGHHAYAELLLIGEPANNETSIPPREYVVPGYLPRGVVTGLIGPPGAGKSQLCIAWSVALALGKEFGAFKPERPRRVALFNVEDDITEQQRRVAAALRGFGAGKADLGGRLLLLNPSRTGMLLTLDPFSRALMPTGLMGELVDMLDSHKPDLLILDPLVELHDAQENDNTSLRHIVAELRVIARSHNIAILLLHHTSKGDPRPGNQDAARGASAIGGVVRKAFTLYEMTKDEASGWKMKQPQFYFRLDGAKSSYDAKNGTEWFERVPILLDNGDMAAAAVPWMPPSEILTDELIAKCLEVVALGVGGQPWSPRLGKYDRSIATALAQLGIGSRKAQENAINALLAAGCTQTYWKKKNRAPATGLRHPDGRPAVDWLE